MHSAHDGAIQPGNPPVTTISLSNRKPTPATQDPACGDAGEFPVLIFNLAVDDGVVDALGELVGLRESGMVDDGLRIKDGYVGKVAGFQQTATVEMFALGGKRSDLANRRFERQEMSVADVMAEETRHGAHGARMRVRFEHGAVKGHFASVEANAGPRLAEAGAEVFFAGHEINRAGLRVVREDEIHERVFRGLLPGFCNVIESFPGELLEFGFFSGGNEDAGGAAAVVVKVFPVGVIAGEIFLDALANGRIFQALEQLLDPAIGNPRRESGRECRSAGGVRIHVGGDVEAGVPRVLNGCNDVFHGAPARPATDLEVKNFNRQICFAADSNGFG